MLGAGVAPTIGPTAVVLQDHGYPGRTRLIGGRLEGEGAFLALPLSGHSRLASGSKQAGIVIADLEDQYLIGFVGGTGSDVGCPPMNCLRPGVLLDLLVTVVVETGWVVYGLNVNYHGGGAGISCLVAGAVGEPIVAKSSARACS